MDSYYESDENDSDRDFPVPPGQEEADLDNVQMSAAELSDAEDDEPAFATEDDMDLERQIAALDDQRRQLEKARTRRRRQVNAGRGLDLGSPGTDNDPSEDYKSSRQSLEAEKDVDITSNKRGVSRKAPKPSSKVHKRRKRKVPSVSAPKKHETRAPQHDDGPILPPLDAPAPIDQPVVLESHDDLERARLARLERKKKQKSRTDKKKPIVVMFIVFFLFHELDFCSGARPNSQRRCQETGQIELVVDGSTHSRQLFHTTADATRARSMA
jgi:hypothetical protein